jgi:hypothetical protein
MPEPIDMFLKAENSHPLISWIGPDSLESAGSVVEGMNHWVENTLRPIIEVSIIPIFFGFRKMSVRKHIRLLLKNFYNTESLSRRVKKKPDNG